MSTENAQASIQSRGEQKARKAILSLGLKPVNGINRVTFTRGRGLVYAINNPEVFKSVNSDTHIVFGELHVEDLAARAQQAAMEQQLAADAEKGAEEAEAAPAAVEEEEEEVDATGVEEKDIELVVSQANVSRAKAIKALKNNENDVVNAIMELTM
ncbi:NAC domain-containing protein [Cokeromyces recurvatus]|uniref:NAC domain-containing protein n=1 Tax=Cokeromyces recurvatus TaxID=90255 RepID=UPI00221F3385|nr:NAC domain-containing protein [Cokeromyces recurvatus]KAI7899265.1 NAC domain-containing protein [Cokeromyces recurvatus]